MPPFGWLRQLVMFFAAPRSSSWQFPVFFRIASRSFVAKQKNPSTALFGSPANSLGAPLSRFLRGKGQKPAPGAQRKRHCQPSSFVSLYLSGLGRTRRRLALRSPSGRKPTLGPAPLQPLADTAQGCFSLGMTGNNRGLATKIGSLAAFRGMPLIRE